MPKQASLAADLYALCMQLASTPFLCTSPVATCKLQHKMKIRVGLPTNSKDIISSALISMLMLDRMRITRCENEASMHKRICIAGDKLKLIPAQGTGSQQTICMYLCNYWLSG